MPGLDLLFNAAYFDATVKDVSLRNGSPLPSFDVDPTYAPEFQATGLIRYAFDALGGKSLCRLTSATRMSTTTT